MTDGLRKSSGKRLLDTRELPPVTPSQSQCQCNAPLAGIKFYSCCLFKYHPNKWLKANTIILVSLMVLCVMKSERAQWSSSKVSHSVIVRWWLALEQPWYDTGTSQISLSLSLFLPPSPFSPIRSRAFLCGLSAWARLHHSKVVSWQSNGLLIESFKSKCSSESRGSYITFYDPVSEVL